MSQTRGETEKRSCDSTVGAVRGLVNVSSRHESEQEAVYLLRDVNSRLRASLISMWMKVDLSFAQLRTLLVLAEGGPLTVGQVAKELGIGVSTAGHLVERLVRIDMAQRQEDATDRRRVLVSLTAQGHAFRERLLGELTGLGPALQALSDDELAAFIYGMRAIARELARRTQ